MKYRYPVVLIIFAGFSFFFYEDKGPLQGVQKNSTKTISLIKKKIETIKTTPSKKTSELELAGLSEHKIKAIYDLRNFHNEAPIFNEENIRKRNEFLDELTKNTPETVKAFSKIMKTSKDDSLKSFLLNITMNTSMDDSDKAEIFMSRIKLGANFSHEGLVPDEEMSLIIGISHLSRLEDERVKIEAVEKMMNNVEVGKNKFLSKTLEDYLGPSTI